MEGFHYLNVTFRIDCYPKAQIKRHVKSQCFSCFVFFKLTKELHSRAAFCTDRSLVEGPLHLPSPETQNAGLEDESGAPSAAVGLAHSSLGGVLVLGPPWPDTR